MKVYYVPRYLIERDADGNPLRMFWAGSRRIVRKTRADIAAQCERIMQKRPSAKVNQAWLRALR